MQSTIAAAVVRIGCGFWLGARLHPLVAAFKALRIGAKCELAKTVTGIALKFHLNTLFIYRILLPEKMRNSSSDSGAPRVETTNLTANIFDLHFSLNTCFDSHPFHFRAFGHGTTYRAGRGFSDGDPAYSVFVSNYAIRAARKGNANASVTKSICILLHRRPPRASECSAAWRKTHRAKRMQKRTKRWGIDRPKIKYKKNNTTYI